VIECATAAGDPTRELAEALEGVDDVAVATDRGGREALWAYRERITEAVSAAGVPHKLDVTVPVARLAEFDRRLRARVGEVAPEARLVLFGHLADGNLHVNLLGPGLEEAVDAAHGRAC
jgi:FAD/FMN-containing dehydrogenase